MIQNISNQRIMIPQVQNLGLQKIVNQINENVGKRRNFDVVELSQKAQTLLHEKNETKEKEPVTSDADSEMVKDPWVGERSKAELAEMSLDMQRHDLKSLSNQLEHDKAKVEFTASKIEELENFLNGTASHSDPNMTQETAKAYLHNYKQSVLTDYANWGNLSGFGNSFLTNKYDALSGGLASQVIENQLDSLNSESLGLANLSSDPKEMIKAFENAYNQVNRRITKIEDAFAKGAAGKGFDKPAQGLISFGEDYLKSFDFFASQMETGYRITSADLKFNGEKLEIDKTPISNL